MISFRFCGTVILLATVGAWNILLAIVVIIKNLFIYTSSHSYDANRKEERLKSVYKVNMSTTAANKNTWH